MWDLFDFVDERGRNIISQWMTQLQPADRARLERKLDDLQINGPNLSSKLLSDTTSRRIKKIRVNGQVALRPLLCRGPINNDQEFTLLLGATERDRRMVPRDALRRARDHRE